MSGAYDERIRLGEIIADVRKFLAVPAGTLAEFDEPAKFNARRLGQAEALLAMLANSAEIVASQKPEG